MHANPAPPPWLILLLGALTALAPLSIAMYLSAFPALAREFADSKGVAQYSLAVYLVGMATGQLFYGPLSDRFGRKAPLLAGLALYMLAGLGCAVAADATSLLVWRFLQALGGCAGVVIPLAMVRDLYDHRSSARVLSRLMLVMGAAPILAPWIGTQVMALFGWRAVFYVLAGYGALALAAVQFALPVSLPATRRHAASGAAMARTYWSLLRDRRFMGYALTGAFASAGMFSYIAASPTVMIEHYGLSAQAFSWMYGANALALIAASQWNHRLLATRHPDRVLHAALVALCLFGAALTAATVSTLLGLPGVLLALFFCIGMMGFTAPNSAAGAMAPHGAQAGSASALLGTLRFGIATVGSAVAGVFNDGSARPMAMAIAVFGIAGWLSYSVLARAQPSR